jgi:hypothetical protein
MKNVVTHDFEKFIDSYNIENKYSRYVYTLVFCVFTTLIHVNIVFIIYDHCS